jgi:hypothetical protein
VSKLSDTAREALRAAYATRVVMKLHPSITAAVVMDACERHNNGLDNPGFCIACGLEHDGIEPDARKYECESCGTRTVYGAEELLFRL